MKVSGRKILLTTQDNFSEYDIIQTLGLVRGNTIRARHVGKDILAGLRSIVGGEITEYTKMLAESREQAIDRMFAEAEAWTLPVGTCAGYRRLQFVPQIAW